MSIDITLFTRGTRWSYDNGWPYQGQYWDAFNGPHFAKEDYLVLLNEKQGTVVLHLDHGLTTQIWSGQIADRADFDKMIESLASYEKAYREKKGIDPSYDYELEYIRKLSASHRDPPGC